MKKYYLDKRVFVNGKDSHLSIENKFDLQSYILNSIFGSSTSTEPITALNGITLNSDNEVKLGGTLTASTTINKGAFFFRTIGEGDNLFRTINGDLDTLLWTTANSAIMSATDNNAGTYCSITTLATGNVAIVTQSGIVNIDGLLTYADEAAAALGGILSSNDIYKTATGELRIKL